MSLPKKIEDSYIKDSIVELKFSTILPFEILLGQIYNSLDSTYTYVPNFNSFEISNSPISLNVQPSLFYNDKIKMQLLPNSIIFNSIKTYIGWDEYSMEIKKVLFQLSQIKEITTYFRIGVRYISEFPNVSLRTSIKFDFSFNFPDVKSDTFSFRSEFQKNQQRVILNLNDSLPYINDGESTCLSQIDIDVIDDQLNLMPSDIEVIIEKINLAHDTEKQMFFGLLTDDFLKSLNPIY